MPLSDLYLSAYFLPAFALLFLAGMLVAIAPGSPTARTSFAAPWGWLITVRSRSPSSRARCTSTPDIQAAIAQKLSSTRKFSVRPPRILPPIGQKSDLRLAHTLAYTAIHRASPRRPRATWGGSRWRWRASASSSRARVSRAMLFWLVLGVAEFLFSLGPALHSRGTSRLLVPFYGLLYSSPILSNYRAPNRFAPVVLLAVCVLAAYGLVALFARVRGFADAHPDLPERLRHAAVPALGVLVIVRLARREHPVLVPLSLHLRADPAGLSADGRRPGARPRPHAARLPQGAGHVLPDHPPSRAGDGLPDPHDVPDDSHLREHPRRLALRLARLHPGQRSRRR